MPEAQSLEACDAVVVGAGIGGIYAVHRLVRSGLSVVGIESAPDVGGVWYHNRYPGARVDLEGLWYCYHDPELYRSWRWSERYPAQPELLAYLRWAAQRWDVTPRFSFNTTMTSGRWDEESRRWIVTTGTGRRIAARYLVMATGNLSAARMPELPGLADFDGVAVRTAHWPDPSPDLAGRRVGLIGTSASGVQSAPHLAEAAEHLTIFQRTPHYSAPAHNSMLDPARIDAHLARADTLWEEIVAHPGGTDIPLPAGPARSFSPEQQRRILDAHWAYGAHALGSVFSDQGTDAEVNEIVATYVRAKIAEKIKTAQVAERVMPRAYPIGTHRLAVDVSYYETFNRDNVSLVSLLDDPIERIVGGGIRLASGRVVELDVLVLATGFHSITGALYAATLTGVGGVGLAAHWARGPMAYLGLMTRHFPNLFFPTGPGSPSVLANMFADNEQHIDLAAALIDHMAAHEHTRVEPTTAAEEWWRQEMRTVSERLLRYRVDNYMVHVNPDDASRVFMPYPGGFDRFVRVCDEVVAAGFTGFDFA